MVVGSEAHFIASAFVCITSFSYKCIVKMELEDNNVLFKFPIINYSLLDGDVSLEVIRQSWQEVMNEDSDYEDWDGHI